SGLDKRHPGREAQRYLFKQRKRAVFRNLGRLRMVTRLHAFLLAATTLASIMALAGAASAADEITIGAPLPLTGALSPEGEKLKMGYELWLEELDKRGGIDVGGVKHKVKLVYSDYQSQTPRAVQLAEKLITSDKVNFLFSP